jgi:hypothetical protein
MADTTLVPEYGRTVELELLKDKAASLQADIAELESNERFLESREDIFLNKRDRMNLQKEYNEVLKRIKDLE